MRTEIVHLGAGELTYEIRGIMDLVETLNTMGMKITLENIGDPCGKG
jgi:alanine-synthesizing transaminase